MGSTYSLAERVRDECRARDGHLNLDGANLSNEDMTDLADGLRMAFQEGVDDALTLKSLLLPRNDFDDEGLATLANVLKELPQCRKTLKVLHIFSNPNITTLAPLSSAGTFDSLKVILAFGCSLSGALRNILPPELCSNLPALEEIDLSQNMGGSIITLTAETLRALPSNCVVPIYNSRVQVKLPDGNFDLLPTREHQPFGFFQTKPKTVADIAEFARVDLNPLVKRARAKCGACYLPRPQYLCGACMQRAYCNEICQLQDWEKQHRESCSKQ